jgi:hypothetical protein
MSPRGSRDFGQEVCPSGWERAELGDRGGVLLRGEWPPLCIAPDLARELGDDHAVAIGAPVMWATARRNLEAAAARSGARSGAWLGTGDILRRQAGHRPEPHVIAAAEDLVTHLAATGENTPTAAACS